MVHPPTRRLTEIMNNTPGYWGGPDQNRPPVAQPSARQTSTALRVPLLVAAMVTTGLMAGMFFAYSFSVMPGLARVDDRTFVVAMQQVNDATVESVTFQFTFSIALVLLGAAAVVHYRLGFRTATWWILAALSLYVVAFGITMAVHIPLVEALDAAGNPSQEELHSVRTDFEDPWNSAHTTRTITGALALACLGLAGSARARSPWQNQPSADRDAWTIRGSYG